MIFAAQLYLKAFLVVFVTPMILFLTCAESYAQGFYGSWGESNQFIVFIDPGHGGEELGARGSSAMLEKNITLKLAELIKKRLLADERIEAILSRIDDINLGAIERINMANLARANLFIGIHTDGGSRPHSHPIKIFLWGEEDNIDTAEDVKSEGEVDKAKWSHLNAGNKVKSEGLAGAMKERLGSLDPTRGVDIVESDRMLLGGLMMPAIIAEPLDLANPQDEIKLQDSKHLKSVAKAMTDAIYDYLQALENWER